METGTMGNWCGECGRDVTYFGHAPSCPHHVDVGALFGTVREALGRLRAISFRRRYGGYGEDYKLALAALAALERIERPKLL